MNDARIVHDVPASDDTPADALQLVAPAPAPRASRRRASTEVAPAAPLLERPAALQTASGRCWLGTSSWSFPGWKGLVYAGEHAESVLARRGLAAYARHPLLDLAGIDRGFYAALEAAQLRAYAQQVPADFRFLVKAPDFITGAMQRNGQGRPTEPNPSHLDATLAIDQFVEPCREGLGRKLGVLVFQCSPLPRAWLRDPARWIERLGAFLERLPSGTPYAVEIRDPELLTPRLMRTLRAVGAGYCIGLHARMPPIDRQLRALDALEKQRVGPLVVRWSLHPGIDYAQAKSRYAPFTRLVDEDADTRERLAERAAAVLRAGQPVYVAANNKAEGSAPLTLAALAERIAARLSCSDDREAAPLNDAGATRTSS